jgi:hypothetical protein
MKSVMDHSFSVNPQVDLPRSSFDRSSGHKTAFDAGELVPVYVDEALPGDTFNMNAAAFGRLATPIYPLMDNQHVDVHFFSVPCRQLWANFRRFIGEWHNTTDNPNNYSMPQVNVTSVGANTFEDYMGIPINKAASYSSLFLRAYQHIYNEWYRDQNLINPQTVSLSDADTASSSGHTLLKRGKRHDYFTSCLPWPQKGDAVDLPLGTDARVTWDGVDGTTIGVYHTPSSGIRRMDTNLSDHVQLDDSGVPGQSLYADLTNATAATINQLRQAFQIQKLLEKDARGGTRYSEIIKAHFGVEFFDVTYRPEFLGGGSAIVSHAPVAQTSNNASDDTPQGNLASFATVGMNNISFTKSFNEHCIIMGIASVRSDLTYQNGMNRMFSRETRYDFYWPSLAHIGEQAVLNKEIYLQGTSADDDVFGYQERYAEYRYKPSVISGPMRSAGAGTLDSWHLAQNFTSLPSLNQTFIEEDPPMNRVLAVSSEPHFIFDFHFNLRCARPMPLFGIPGMIDHF